MFTTDIKILLLFIFLAVLYSRIKGMGRSLLRGNGDLMRELQSIEAIKSPQEKGRAGELFIAKLLERSGHKNVQVTPPTADGGRDVDTYYNGENWSYEVKFWKYNPKDFRSQVGQDVGRSLLGHILSNEHKRPKRGAIVTTSYFSKKCKVYCDCNNIQMIDRDDLLDWITRLDG